jgi:hypothetical protein
MRLGRLVTTRLREAAHDSPDAHRLLKKIASKENWQKVKSGTITVSGVNNKDVL